MKNIVKKVIVMATVLSMILSLAVVPGFAATVKTFVFSSDLEISDAETGELASGSTSKPVQLLATDSAKQSTAYYQSGDEFLTLQTRNDYTVDAGAHIQYNFRNVTTTMELRAKLGFDAQTAEISWRPYGYSTTRSAWRRDKVVSFKDGNVAVGSTNVLTYDSTKTYDLVIRYQTASTDTAQDAKIMISLSDGSTVSSYTGTPDAFYSEIAGSAFVAHIPSSGFNKLKIYDGLTVSSIAGIPYFGNDIEDIDFDGWTDSKINVATDNTLWEGTNTKILIQGNEASIVDEAGGAFDGDSAKFVGTAASTQIRPQTGSSVPVRFEFKMKIEDFGFADNTTISYTGANSCGIFTINNARELKLQGDGMTVLDADRWYLFRGYHNPGVYTDYTDDYVYLELCTPEGRVLQSMGKSTSFSGRTDRPFMQLFAPKDSIIYIDDWSVSEASSIVAASNENFGVTSMFPKYDTSIPMYYDAQITFTKAADITEFTADNIYICKDGNGISADGYSWNEDKTVLSIPLNVAGHYRICVFGLKDADGNAIENPFMEFEVTEPKVLFTPSGSDMIATYKAKGSDMNNTDSAVMLIAGYKDKNLHLSPVTDKDEDVMADEVTTLTATLPGGAGLTDVRVFIWEGFDSLTPITKVSVFK